MKPTEAKTVGGSLGNAISAAPWQFSLRSLLALTTIVSVCLAVGVHFAGFMFVVVAVGLLQATILLSADWLIRPANRRVLAFVTAGSWIVMGSGLLTIGCNLIYDAVAAKGDSASASVLGAGLIFVAVLCYGIAARRWWKISAQRAIAPEEPR